MRLLDPKKDRELYNFSNDMLMILNRFLTNNQNNYKRWFNHVTDKDEVKDNQTKNTLIVHCTPINKIQEQYYNYNKIMTEFREVNEFFMKKVKSKFDINTEKWDSF